MYWTDCCERPPVYTARQAFLTGPLRRDSEFTLVQGLEAQLYYLGFDERDIEDLLSDRDELLRYLASSSGKKTAMMVAQDLQDARNSEDGLEIQLVAAFEKLGFEAVRLGKKGKADGYASAHLGASPNGNPRAYSVSLEAKSKVTDGRTVAAKNVGISAIARQRNDLSCQHAVVVGPNFPTKLKEQSALAKEIKDDREKYDDKPDHEKRTITIIRIDDLARLIRLAPMKQIGPSNLRELFLTCSTPEEAHDWIDAAVSRTPKRLPYKEVLETIWEEQKDDEGTPVDYSALRTKLKSRTRPIRLSNEALRELCSAMAAMAPSLVIARDKLVELEVPPRRVLDAIEAAAHDLPPDELE